MRRDRQRGLRPVRVALLQGIKEVRHLLGGALVQEPAFNR